MKTTTSYRKILDIAVPIIISSIVQNIIQVTDTAFLGRVGEIELGGSAIGGIFYFAATMVAFGFGMGTQIIIARRSGEEKYSEIGKTVEHAQLFLVLLSLFLFTVFEIFATDILNLIVQSDAITSSSNEYFSYRIYGIFFSALNISFNAFYIGIARTRVITISSVIMAVVNIILDYIFIFGKFGFPVLGVKGAAIASVIAELSGTIFYFLYSSQKIYRNQFKIFHFVTFDKELFSRIIKVSLPIMVQFFVSISSWFTFFLMVEKMGEHSLAIANVVRSVYIIVLIPVWGFASSTNTLVSSRIGENNVSDIIPLIRKTILLSVVCVTVLVLPTVILPGTILSIYTNSTILISDSMSSLYVVCIAAIFLAIAMSIFSGVSGTGKTIVSFKIEVSALAIYITSIYVFTHYGTLVQVWTSEISYSVVLMLVSMLYLRYGNWKKTTV